MARPTVEQLVHHVTQRQFYTIDSHAVYDIRSRDPITTHYRSYSGTTTPGFKGYKKRSLPFNGYTLDKYSRSSGGAVWNVSWLTSDGSGESHTHTMGGSKWASIYVSGDLIGSGHLPDAEFRASADLGRKFNEVKTNLPMLFKERVKTSQMIYKTAGRLVLAMNALRKLRFGEMYRHLGINPAELYPAGLMRLKRLEEVMDRNRRKAGYNKRKGRKKGRTARYTPPESEISGMWLEVSFGWKPLLQDIFKSAELLASRYQDDKTRYSAKGVGEDTLTVRCAVYPHPDVSYFISPDLKAGTSTVKTITKLIAEYSISSADRIKMAETGITNPLLVAWDAVPLSFVVDWFLPVNNWLKQLDTYSGFTLAAVKRVQFTRVHTQVSSNQNVGRTTVGAYTYFDIRMSAQVFADKVLYTRDSIGTPPYVPLQFRDPFKPKDKNSNDMNLFPAVTTLALLTQAFNPKYATTD